ncbi:MAG: methyltransferase domain-containing protein [Opitutus sp.]|nr:methyltransferase domain-containing protein [Opitutus sp.]
MELTRLPETDPLEIYRYRDGLYAVDLLAAALTEFDFFTWLGAHPSDKTTICRELGLTERPTDVMLTLFSANGFLHCDRGVFHLTPVAREHLVSTSPWFLGPYYGSMKERPVVRDYVKILCTGKPANWASYKNEKPWSDAMLTEEFATTFTAAMDCRGFYLGAVMAKKLDTRGRARLLDIAGGSGIYACAITAQHPHLSATVFERPPVDQIARTMIQKRGCADKVSVVAGDMFVDPLPAGFDVHLYSNVLHDWDVDKVRPLLAASFHALAPGGMLIVHDCHLNADKTGPLPVAKYSALLMSVTEGKCYSVAEMETLLAEAGFRDFHHEPTIADRSIVTVRKPVNPLTPEEQMALFEKELKENDWGHQPC